MSDNNVNDTGENVNTLTTENSGQGKIERSKSPQLIAMRRRNTTTNNPVSHNSSKEEKKEEINNIIKLY